MSLLTSTLKMETKAIPEKRKTVKGRNYGFVALIVLLSIELEHHTLKTCAVDLFKIAIVFVV